MGSAGLGMGIPTSNDPQAGFRMRIALAQDENRAVRNIQSHAKD